MKMTKPQLSKSNWRILFSGILILGLIATVAIAQRRGGGGSHQKKNAEGLPTYYEVPKDQADLSGKFIMARLRFDVSMYGWNFTHLGDGGFPWSHDWPGAGRHLNKIVSELSKLDINLDVNEPIYGFTDADLYKYPMAYLCEVGYMNLTDQELQGMREYCLRGGFILVDDFRLQREWYPFEAQIKRAFPEYQLKKLDISHPIFNCFFSIKTLDVPPPYGNFGPIKPEFWGVEDDKGRLMMVINYNNDVSDYWQWSDNPFDPIGTNEAYKFGVNYVMYALTH